jgi:hypothetical protein
VEHKSFKLPAMIIGQIDIARSMRELNALNDFFTGSKHRSPGAAITPPKLSRQLDQLARLNGFNLLEETHRSQLYETLNLILGKAPKVHISFASEASPKALDILITWFRTNIHPQILLQVGLQPNVAAGCVLRTPNRVIDMSMRSHLKTQEKYLVQLIAGAVRSGAGPAKTGATGG